LDLHPGSTTSWGQKTTCLIVELLVCLVIKQSIGGVTVGSWEPVAVCALIGLIFPCLFWFPMHDYARLFVCDLAPRTAGHGIKKKYKKCGFIALWKFCMNGVNLRFLARENKCPAQQIEFSFLLHFRRLPSVEELLNSDVKILCAQLVVIPTEIKHCSWREPAATFAKWN
jgi:hypothetical protein